MELTVSRKSCAILIFIETGRPPTRSFADLTMLRMVSGFLSSAAPIPSCTAHLPRGETAIVTGIAGFADCSRVRAPKRDQRWCQPAKNQDNPTLEPKARASFHHLCGHPQFRSIPPLCPPDLSSSAASPNSLSVWAANCTMSGASSGWLVISTWDAGCSGLGCGVEKGGSSSPHAREFTGVWGLGFDVFGSWVLLHPGPFES